MTDEELNALDEVYDTMMEVERNPTGAWQAIQDQADAITTLRAQLAEARAGELAWAETAKMHLKAEQAFLSWLRDAGEHLRTEGVTICDDGTDSGEVLAAKVAECVGILKDRADRAEAALAAQIEADAGIADECERQNGPLSKRGSDPYVQGLSSAGQAIAAAIRAQPHDRTALDRMLAEAREKALQEAAQACEWGDIYGGNAIRTILALIEKEKTK